VLLKTPDVVEAVRAVVLLLSTAVLCGTRARTSELCAYVNFERAKVCAADVCEQQLATLPRRSEAERS
jgi:hypothetical protein